MNYLIICVLQFFICGVIREEEISMKIEKVQANLKTHVVYFADVLGQRSYLDMEKLEKAGQYIEEKFRSYLDKPSLPKDKRSDCVKRQSFTFKGNTYYNIIAEIEGTEKEKDGVLIIGAHYDTVQASPGADDNASGVAGLLELVRLTASKPFKKTVYLVAFCLEEPPFFRTKNMGSYVYAKSLKKAGTKVYGMISLEMLGYFRDEKNSQHYPLPMFKWFYPDKGNFIGFVGNTSSAKFTKKVKSLFKSVSSFPVESLNTLPIVPGIDLSDNWSFYKFGYPAFMITDTAFYRNPNYHELTDTSYTLDYKRMAELIAGLHNALSQLL